MDNLNVNMPSNDDKRRSQDEKICVIECKKQTDLNEQQADLEKRTFSLIKRIKRLQAKQLEKHTIKQLQYFVKQQQLKLGIGCQLISKNKEKIKIDRSHASYYRKICQQNSPSAEDKIKLFAPEGVKSLSTSALVNLVKTLGNNSDQQNPNKISHSSVLNAPTSDNVYVQNDVPPLLINQKHDFYRDGNETKFLEPQEAEVIKTVAGTLKTNLRHLENSYDSDATESSSGGESCDECELNYNYFKSDASFQVGSNTFNSIQQKPIWKWLRERSAIASRWTWLQAQVADLEFKIRQQNEMYRQLRANKGSIAFTCKETSSVNISNGCVTKSPQTNEQQSQGSETLQSYNDKESNGSKETLHCARILPLKQMRKRKLVRSSNALAGATRKIARYSTIQCSCTNYPTFAAPCVLCNGRYSYLQVIDTDCMPHYERYALLDPSYHPVLSLPNDVALGLHFSRLLKKETVQKLVPLKQPNKKSNHTAEFSFKFGPDGAKLNRKKSQAIISSTKLKKKYDGATKKKLAKASNSRGLGKRNLKDKHDSNGSADENSPSASPLPSDNYSLPINRRRRSEQYAYDINNIVIPYSIASATRVEKLKYKEIITPKWRYIDENSLPIEEEAEETDEDISDDAFAMRHLKCEADEKKHFCSFLKNPHGTSGPGRGRGSRTRLDSSKSDGSVVNSGANESTQNIDCSSQDSLVTSPINICMNSKDLKETLATQPNFHAPANSTPENSAVQNVQNSQNLSNLQSQQNSLVQLSVLKVTTPNSSCELSLSQEATTHGTPAKTTERHRTSSSSKKEDSGEDENFVEITPFEKRKFPLSESEYQEMVKVSMECLMDRTNKVNDGKENKEKAKDVVKEDMKALEGSDDEKIETINDNERVTLDTLERQEEDIENSKLAIGESKDKDMSEETESNKHQNEPMEVDAVNEDNKSVPKEIQLSNTLMSIVENGVESGEDTDPDPDKH